MKERIMAVLRHEEPDLIPWVPNMDHWYNVNRRRYSLPGDLAGYNYHDIKRKLKAGLWVRCGLYKGEMPNVRVKEVVRSDIYKGEIQRQEIHRTYETPAGIVFTKNVSTGPFYGFVSSHPVEYMIKDLPDYDAVKFMVEDTQYTPTYDVFLAAEREVGDDGIALGGGHGCPLNGVFGYTGFVKGIIDSYRYPKEFDKLARAIEERAWETIQIAADSPADVIMMGSVDGVEPSSLFEKYSIPFHRKAMHLLHAKGKVSSCHAHTKDFSHLLNLFPKTNIDIAESFTPPPQGVVRVDEARAVWKDKVIIWGGVPAVIVSQWSPNEVGKYVLNLFKSIVPGDNFVLAMGDNVPPDANIECVKAIADVVEKHGKYPLL